MKIDRLNYALSLLNYGLGGLIGLISLISLIKHKSVVPIFITFAIIIAGPLEDVLVNSIQSNNGIPKNKKESYVALVDQTTSLGFMVFLLLAAINSID